MFGWLLALAAGFGLGAFYFGGLWWTVQRITTARGSGLLVLVSFIFRTALTLVGFYFAAGGDWIRLLLCLAGFLLARTTLVRRWGPQTQA